MLWFLKSANLYHGHGSTLQLKSSVWFWFLSFFTFLGRIREQLQKLSSLRRKDGERTSAWMWVWNFRYYNCWIDDLKSNPTLIINFVEHIIFGEPKFNLFGQEIHQTVWKPGNNQCVLKNLHLFSSLSQTKCRIVILKPILTLLFICT